MRKSSSAQQIIAASASTAELAVPRTFMVPDHVLAVKGHLLVMFHAGFSLKDMVEAMGGGFVQRDVKNAILTATEAEHTEARMKAPNIPRLAKDRLKGAGLRFADTLIDMAETAQRPADRIKASIAGLQAGEVINTHGGEKAKQEPPMAVTQEDVDKMERYYRESHVHDAIEE